MGPCAHCAQGDPLNEHAGDSSSVRPLHVVPASVVAPVAATDAARSGQIDMGELVAEARGGSRSAFDALVRRTWEDTYSLAYRLTGNAEDARDVCQEAYLRAFRGLRRFRGDARFTTWLYRITANCASTQLGRRSRHHHEQLDDELELNDDSPTHDPVARSESASLRDSVQRALASLPPRLRAVVVLRDIYDLSHEVIAAELGISVSAAKVRLHRARLRLRDDVSLRSEAAATRTEGRGPDDDVNRPAV